MLTTLLGCSGGHHESTGDAPVKDGAKDVRTEDCVLDPPRERVMCTQQYDPVCGCDGKTYGNACTAGAAGVPKHTPGACGDDGYRLD